MRILICILIMTVSWTLDCFGGTGTNTGFLLQTTTGARPAARGESFVAASDINSIYYNPSGLAFISNPQISVMYIKGSMDTNYEYLAGVLPLKNIGTLGLSIFAFQGGTIDITDSYGVTTTKNAENDYLISLAYGNEIFKKLGFGITAKALLSSLAETYNANAYTFDIGLIYCLEDNFKLGLSAANLIGGLKYFETTDKLPLLIRGGGEYTLNVEEEHEVCISADVLSSVGKIKVSVGTEYSYQKFLFVRLGYKTGEDIGGLSLGVGYKINLFDDLVGSFDYAFLPASGWADSHKVSLNIYFGETLTEAKNDGNRIKVKVPGRVIQ